MTKKIRIARSGYNAITETNTNNLIFDSSLNTFKILAEGTITNQSITANPTTVQVAHGQSSVPAVFAFVDLGDGYVSLPSETDYTFTLYGGRYYLVDIDGTYIYFKFYKGSDVASTSGPYRPNTADDYAAVGSTSWSNPSDVYTSNNAYASALMVAPTQTHWLRIYNYGFNIPTNATINGITVSIEGHYDGSGTWTLEYVQLFLSGNPIGSNKVSYLPNTTDGVNTAGGSSDTWGRSWTASEINSSTFGVGISTTHSSGANRNLYIDYVSIEVNYTVAAQNYTVSSIRYFIFETPIA